MKLFTLKILKRIFEIVMIRLDQYKFENNNKVNIIKKVNISLFSGRTIYLNRERFHSFHFLNSAKFGYSIPYMAFV